MTQKNYRGENYINYSTGFDEIRSLETLQAKTFFKEIRSVML